MYLPVPQLVTLVITEIHMALMWIIPKAMGLLSWKRGVDEQTLIWVTLRDRRILGEDRCLGRLRLLIVTFLRWFPAVTIPTRMFRLL